MPVTRKVYVESVKEDKVAIDKLMAFKTNQYGTDNDYAGSSRISMVLSNLSESVYWLVLMSKHLGFIISIIYDSDRLKNKDTAKKFRDSMRDIHVFLYLISVSLKSMYPEYAKDDGEIDR